MKKVVFLFVLALGFAWNSPAQTWTFVQEAQSSYCVTGQSTCQFSAGTLAPTTAGTVRIIFLRTANASNAPNVTISSVSGAGSTWNLCPASSCHILGNDNLDMAYAIGGSGGQTNITVTLSGSSGSAFFTVIFYEFLPPAGATASFDTSGTVNHSCTSGSTTGVGLTLSANSTDLILTGRGNGDPSGPFAYSSPYTQTPYNNAFSLNDSTGAAPTMGCSGSSLIYTAIAFKSSAGLFTPPTPHMKAANYTNLNDTQPSCNPSCTLTIPQTTVGNLLYLQAADINNVFISSVSGGGAWVVPSGANTCHNEVNSAGTSNAISCAYILSMTSSVTSLTVTMTGSGAAAFAIMEVHPLNGATFSLDAEGSTINPLSFAPPGQALSLTGTDDAIFQTIFVPGGNTAVTDYPMPPSAPKTATEFWLGQASFVAALDAPYGAFPSNAQPIWGDQQGSQSATVVSGVAFKISSGTATAPNPPTGLTAAVN